MGKTPRRVHDGIAGYLRKQLDVLGETLPTAMKELAGESVHDARVATRRLRAGLKLLEPVLPRQPARRLNRLGRTVRRELGPIRDADVMIGHLRSLKVSSRLLPALEWMVGELRRRQELARRESKDWTPAERVLAKIEKRWAELAPQLEEVKPAVRHLLAESLHAQADRFTADADAIATQSVSAAPVDPHQLRIDGKQLRYTVELAQAEGVRFRASVLRRLKRLQDALGIWHDHVVLTTTAMTLAQERRLAYLEPTRLREVMQLSAKLTRLSEKRMAAFCKLWRRQGAELIKSIRDKAPLDVRAVAATDPDPPATDPDTPAIDPVPPAITAPQTDRDPFETPAPTVSASSTSATRPAE